MKPFFSKDFQYKLASLLVAIVIWIYVSIEIVGNNFFHKKNSDMKEIVFRNVPVKILGLPNNGSQSVMIKPQMVLLRVSIPKGLENTITSKDIVPYVDHNFLLDGTYETVLRFILPKGVRILSSIKCIQLVTTNLSKRD